MASASVHGIYDERINAGSGHWNILKMDTKPRRERAAEIEPN